MNQSIRTASLAATVAALAFFAAAGPVTAHGIWFAQRATQLALIYGVGADDLDSVKRQPLVERIDGYDESGAAVPAQLRVAGPLLLVDAESPVSVVSAVLFNGTWSKRPNGEWLKKGRDEVPDATIAEKNYKYAVAIVGPMEKPLGPLPGQRLQIIPVGNIPAMSDKPLRLRVLFEGQPVSGARVLRDYVNDPDAKPLVTGRDGTVTLRVRNQGLNVVTAIFKSPPDDRTKVDHLEHLATLAFTLQHAPE
jgi:nickel transport protein